MVDDYCQNCAIAQLKTRDKYLPINDFSFSGKTYIRDLYDVIEKKEIRKEIINIINKNWMNIISRLLYFDTIII